MTVLNSRNGHRAIGASGFMNKVIKGILAVAITVTAIFFLWWCGCFLPSWVQWEEKSFAYEEAQVKLHNRKLKLCNREENDLSMDRLGRKKLWCTPWDWSVQDVLCGDINRDGKEELVLLVWKHGSYGEHLPFWEKRNDIRLEQHLFIYQWEETRETKLRALWMSSTLDMQVSSMLMDRKGRLVITDVQGKSTRWQWQDFGMKFAGDIKEEQVTFLCAGDNLIHVPMLYGNEDGYSGFYENIREEVQKADIATLNQETIFVKDQGLVSDFPKFGTPLGVGEAIAEAGFNVVTLANNHVLDKGTYGIDVTTNFYREKGITYLGVHPAWEEQSGDKEEITIFKKNDIRFALLNYTYGTNGIPTPKETPYLVERLTDEERVVQQLDAARERADVVMVFVHWGTEYSSEIDEQQQYFTELFLEHGVDVVIGTHPHVLQPYERMTDKQGHEMLVYYSLGNLISAQEQEACKTGGLAEFTVTKALDGKIAVGNERLLKIVTTRDQSGFTTNLLHE